MTSSAPPPFATPSSALFDYCSGLTGRDVDIATLEARIGVCMTRDNTCREHGDITFEDEFTSFFHYRIADDIKASFQTWIYQLVHRITALPGLQAGQGIDTCSVRLDTACARLNATVGYQIAGYMHEMVDEPRFFSIVRACCDELKSADVEMARRAINQQVQTIALLERIVETIMSGRPLELIESLAPLHELLYTGNDALRAFMATPPFQLTDQLRQFQIPFSALRDFICVDGTQSSMPPPSGAVCELAIIRWVVRYGDEFSRCLHAARQKLLVLAASPSDSAAWHGVVVTSAVSAPSAPSVLCPPIAHSWALENVLFTSTTSDEPTALLVSRVAHVVAELVDQRILAVRCVKSEILLPLVLRWDCSTAMRREMLEWREQQEQKAVGVGPSGSNGSNGNSDEGDEVDEGVDESDDATGTTSGAGCALARPDAARPVPFSPPGPAGPAGPVGLGGPPRASLPPQPFDVYQPARLQPPPSCSSSCSTPPSLNRPFRRPNRSAVEALVASSTSSVTAPSESGSGGCVPMSLERDYAILKASCELLRDALKRRPEGETPIQHDVLVVPVSAVATLVLRDSHGSIGGSERSMLQSAGGVFAKLMGDRPTNKKATTPTMPTTLPSAMYWKSKMPWNYGAYRSRPAGGALVCRRPDGLKVLRDLEEMMTHMRERGNAFATVWFPSRSARSHSRRAVWNHRHGDSASVASQFSQLSRMGGMGGMGDVDDVGDVGDACMDGAGER